MDAETLQMPHATDAEEALVGASLQSYEAFASVAEEVPASAFELHRYGLIWDAMRRLYQRQEPIDLVTVAAELRASSAYDMAGGKAELGRLLNTAPSLFAVDAYARQVVEAAQLRALIEVGGKIRAIGYAGGDAEAAADKAEAALLEVTRQTGRHATRGVDAAEATQALWMHIEGRRVRAEADLHTGYYDLDKSLYLMPKELHVIAARPGVGKTAILGCIVAEVAGEQGRQVEWYSLEMDRVAVMARLVSQSSGVPIDRILRARWLSEDEIRCIKIATDEIASWPLHIADRGEFTAAGIRSYARRRAMKYPPALLVTDHIGLTKVSAERRRDPRVQQVGDICKQFKEMAAELDVPHFVAAQLNRQVEGRSIKVPQLSDLRESGDIEQDAYSVSFLHRPTMGEEAALFLSKNRNGPLTKVNLRYEGQTARFLNPSYQGVPGYD